MAGIAIALLWLLIGAHPARWRDLVSDLWRLSSSLRRSRNGFKQGVWFIFFLLCLLLISSFMRHYSVHGWWCLRIPFDNQSQVDGTCRQQNRF